jgi:signal transduction histidine kinase
VLAHGGRLSIEDSPLGGARVAIELRAAPVRRAAASAMIEQRP